MVVVREDVDVGPHVVQKHREPLEQGINRLNREMSEVLVLSLVGCLQSCLNIIIPSMSILHLQPNPARQVLCLNPIEFGLAKRTVQAVDCLVVGVEHVPRSWSKDVHRMNISNVHCDIPKDLTLSTEERCHPPLPHLVVLPIEVRRTRTPFLVRHIWILDRLESMKIRTSSDTNLRNETGDQRGGSEWEPIKILLEGDGHSNKTNTTTKHVSDSTTQVVQDHVVTGVLLVLGTNTQPSEPKLTNTHIRNLHSLLHVLHRSE
jgi:hypothetical protein